MSNTLRKASLLYFFYMTGISRREKPCHILRQDSKRHPKESESRAIIIPRLEKERKGLRFGTMADLLNGLNGDYGVLRVLMV